MKTIPLFLLSLALVGCADSGTTTVAVASPSASIPTPSASPDLPVSPTASPSPSASPQVNREVAQDNLKRTFQLRDLQKIHLKVGPKTIQAWVMDTEPKRAEGLMWLTNRDIKDDEGMLFVFDQPQTLSFWMENTLIPLDLMFVDESKKIINISAGKALDRSPIPAKRPGMYVIEMKLGMAKKWGIKAGDSVGVPADIVSKDHPMPNG